LISDENSKNFFELMGENVETLENNLEKKKKKKNFGNKYFSKNI